MLSSIRVLDLTDPQCRLARHLLAHADVHTFDVLTGMLGYDTDRVADLAAAEVLE